MWYATVKGHFQGCIIANLDHIKLVKILSYSIIILESNAFWSHVSQGSVFFKYGPIIIILFPFTSVCYVWIHVTCRLT